MIINGFPVIIFVLLQFLLTIFIYLLSERTVKICPNTTINHRSNSNWYTFENTKM